MGRKLDLSGLTDNEAQHVLQVVQRDMKLRKTEEERLSELKQELDEEGSRCLLLSRQSCFNQRCCIRCCSPFTFLLNPKRQCQDCCYNVCKACRVYNKRDKAWLCSACQKRRLLKAQSLEWFYTNVKQRFKRFGSAKVLKTLYRKHVAEHSALSELTEGSAYEESICNEGSVCESDSNFYRQSEEHSMAETLTVALRVAEEAIDEAISKAEFDVASQEQNEALYLREHRGELIEELAKTIVQKIVSRRKTLAEKDTDPHHHHQSISAQTSTTHQPGLWRSQSAFSLLNDDPPDLIEQSLQALKKEGGGGGGSSSGGGGGPPMSAWKSVDRLDNSVLKSPDGNWIALQSAQLSRPGLLTRRKSLVYSALERESRVVSAYEGMGSDNESKPEPDSSWGAVLHEIHKKMMDSNLNVQDGQDRSPTPVKGRRGSRDYLFSDSESKSSKPVIALLKRKVPAEIRRPSSSRRTSIIDVNFNIGETEEEDEEKEEESSMAAELEKGKVKKTRKKRRSKKEQLPSSSVSDSNKKDKQSRSSSDAVTPDTLTSGAVTPEHLDIEREETGHEANQVEDVIMFKFKHLAGRALDSSTQEEKLDEDFIKERRRGSEDRDEGDEMSWKMEINLDEERDFEMDEEMKSRLYKLVAQSRLTYFSSTDDELNQVGDSEGEWDEDKRWEEKTEGLTFKLCRLEKEVRATQFSSTEDELDRIGIDEKTEEEELAVKVCRLASQVNATQFSSTEDELDRAGIGEDEAIDDEETLWKLQAEKALQAAQLRDLASLVSGSQFSSTEDELDRVKENEGEREWEANEGGTENGFQMEEVWKGAVRRRRSFSDLDVKMFDMRDETQETETENILDGQIKTDDVQRSTTEAEEPEWTDSLEEGVSGEIEDEVISVEEQKCEDALEEEQEIKSLMEAEETKEVIDSKEMRVEQEYQPGANRPLNNEEDGQREEFKESKDGKGRWETTTDSEEEDTEFDRIISSMLMMTLEDMQEEMPKDPVSENVRRNTETEVCVTTGKESDAQSTTPPEEMGGAKEFESRGDNVFAARGGAGENATEETGGNVSEEKGEGEITRRNKNEQEERGMEKQDEIDALNMNEAQQTVGEEKSLEEQSGTSSPQEGLLSPEEIQQGSDKDVYKTIDLISSLLKQRYSAGSLRSITTEVLKVLNATEELLQGMEGGDGARLSSTPLPLNTDPKKLDQQFSRLEENVYVAAGSVFSLEAELSDLEECARGICSSTSDLELSFLEEQVASAAAKVQQSELQICDISARIAALKSAGLNVDPQSRLPKTRTVPVMSVTLDSSRQLRRRLPAPPAKEDKET